MPVLSYLRIAGIVVMVLLFPAGVVVGCVDEKERFDAHLKLDKAIGKAADERRRTTIAADKKRKDAADAENSAALAALAGRLRDARSRPVSAPAACPSSPDGAARFRTESDRAYRDFVEGLRAEGERCSKALIGLNTAKGWAVR